MIRRGGSELPPVGQRRDAMKIKNARVFSNGRFIQGGIAFSDRIEAIGTEITDGFDAQGGFLIPGLVDIHTHGAVGEDAGDGRPEGLVRLSRYYAAQGVTSWCPTTETLKETELIRAMHAIRDFVRPSDGAKIAGVHLEGPFLSREKCGAQNPDNLHAPDVDLFNRLNEASGGLVRLVTVAPELPNVMEFIRAASSVCTVSIGHTAAPFDVAAEAFASGASHVTHLFNAMPPLHHREPGVIAAASDAGATAELIVDGLHVHPAAVRLAYRLFGDKLVLISDSLRCAGMPDGEYELGGRSVTVRDGRATLTGTDTLAGGSIGLMEGLRRAVRFGIPLEAAVTAASYTPAKVIGRAGEIGSLACGRAADFVLLGPDLCVRSVWVDGQMIP